jgi:hypothetical protein
MAIPTLNAVGFCAHYSEQGDWAFDYALRLARLHRVQLNVFHFLTDPYGRRAGDADSLSAGEKAKLAIKREKELRLYYDRLAGDYVDVGFRLCEHTEWVELHRCLVVREFQILVLAYVQAGAKFGRRPIEEFAESFICPVVLIGPEQPDQFRLNPPARLIIDKLDLELNDWTLVEKVPA